MPVRYELDPNLPDTVRVIDEDTGMNRPMYSPAKAAEVRGQQAGVPNPAQPWNGKTLPDSAYPDAAAAPPIPAATPPALPPAQTGLAPPSDMAGPFGSMQPGAPPAAPPGVRLTKAELTPGTPGRPYDMADEEARHNDLTERKLQMQSHSDQTQAVLNEQQIRLQQQQADDQKAQQEQAAKSLRYEREIADVNKSMGSMSQIGAIGSIVLGLAGLFVAKRGNNPGAALSRMNQNLEAAIGRDIAIQRNEKNSKLNQLTRQLGDAQQAQLMYRAGVRRAALERVNMQLARIGEDKNLSQLMAAADAEVSAIDDQAKSASFNKPGSAKYEYTQPKPTGGVAPFVPTDKSSQRLKQLLGPDFQKQYLAGMDSKVTSGQTPQTVQTALPAIHQMTDDEATLMSLAKENGGHIPTKGVINVPGALVGKLSQMGVKQGMKAEEARQLIQGYISQKARSYGGVITDSDREQAEREMGASGDGLLRAVSRMKGTLNNGVRQALATHFRGNAQQVLDIALSDYAANSGVPQPSSIEPFDASTAPAAPATPKAPDKPGADPVKTLKTKGFSKAAKDILFDESAVGQTAPGSPL